MSSREITLTAARAALRGSAMREGVTTRLGLSSRVSMSSARNRPGKHAASPRAAKRNRMIMVLPWRSPASTIRRGERAGKNPQTQVALRNAVTANPGPVSGLAKGAFAGMDAGLSLRGAFPHRVQWRCSANGPVGRGPIRLPLRGQCRTLTGFPFHPAVLKQMMRLFSRAPKAMAPPPSPY